MNTHVPVRRLRSVNSKKNNHQPLNFHKPTSGCHSNASNTHPQDVIRRPNNNRWTDYKPPAHNQINHIGLNGPVYNSPHGPITDLRQLLSNRRGGSTRASSTSSYEHRHFRATAHHNPRTQGHRDSPGSSRPPGEAWFGRRGRRGPIRGTPQRPAPVKSNSFTRRRGRQYWAHDDRHEPQRCSQYPTHDVLDTRAADEYIDDFNPEDLAKYKLEIDMDGFTVRSPLLSDPILSMPLSQWNADDLYYSSFLDQEAPEAYTSRSQPAKQRGPRTRRPFGHRRTNHPPRVPRDEPTKAPGKPEATTDFLSVAQECQAAQTNTEYLKPAFQLWMDSGLGSMPKQRHTSELTLRPVTHRAPFELYPSITWPTLRTTMTSCIPTPESSVCELLLDDTTNRRCRSMSPMCTQSSSEVPGSCHPTKMIRSHSS